VMTTMIMMFAAVVVVVTSHLLFFSPPLLPIRSAAASQAFYQGQLGTSTPNDVRQRCHHASTYTTRTTTMQPVGRWQREPLWPLPAGRGLRLSW
jgi:hypothetical protein